MLKSLRQGFDVDRRELSLRAACMRVVRSSAMFTMRQTWRTLVDNPACRGHLDAISQTDRFFFVAHRHYLARGLSRRDRVALAVYHYEQEIATFDAAYLVHVYDQGGLRLWHDERNGAQFEIRLEPGQDVLTEGGLSVVLYVDGGRVCVISLSHVDPNILFDDWGRDREREPANHSLLFITRKQLGSNHRYQRRFNPAFHRATPSHMCMAGIEGLALSLGHSSLAAIRPEAHPGFSEERATRFTAAYGHFWEALAGTTRGRFAYQLPVPLQLPPLERMTSKSRRRARLRRACLEDVRHAAQRVVTSHLRDRRIVAAEGPEPRSATRAPGRASPRTGPGDSRS